MNCLHVFHFSTINIKQVPILNGVIFLLKTSSICVLLVLSTFSRSMCNSDYQILVTDDYVTCACIYSENRLQTILCVSLH